jgi:putative oxidoreductase
MTKHLKCLASLHMIDANFMQSIALLIARLWMAKVFFYAGLTKIKTWDSTLMLFEYEYAVPVLPTEIAAYMATAGELSLPVLLALGLFTPVAALGLFIMALVIELLVYPGTTEHYYWMILLVILMTQGSGKFGLDHFLKKRFL